VKPPSPRVRNTPVAEIAAYAGEETATVGHRADRVVLAAFAGAVLIGGSNFVAIRFSNRELDPLWGAGLRFALAAAVFAILCGALRLSLPRGRALTLTVAYGLLAFGAAYGCLYWAMQDVPAGIASVVLAVGPLLTLLLAVGHGMERLSVRAFVGALVALVGSFVIFFQPGSVDFGVAAFSMLGLAAICASESVVVSKLVGREHPVAMNFVGMSAGAAALCSPPHLPENASRSPQTARRRSRWRTSSRRPSGCSSSCCS
jgi:drug/metabolite transporter (DMT)-like permease